MGALIKIARMLSKNSVFACPQNKKKGAFKK
jgi:hypothetical protein